MKYPETVLQAAYEYVRRQGRSAHPDGHFDSDCRTLPHVANLYGVDPEEVLRAVKEGAWEVLRAQEVLGK